MHYIYRSKSGVSCNHTYDGIRSDQFIHRVKTLCMEGEVYGRCRWIYCLCWRVHHCNEGRILLHRTYYWNTPISRDWCYRSPLKLYMQWRVANLWSSSATTISLAHSGSKGTLVLLYAIKSNLFYNRMCCAQWTCSIIVLSMVVQMRLRPLYTRNESMWLHAQQFCIDNQRTCCWIHFKCETQDLFSFFVLPLPALTQNMPLWKVYELRLTCRRLKGVRILWHPISYPHLILNSHYSKFW